MPTMCSCTPLLDRWFAIKSNKFNVHLIINQINTLLPKFDFIQPTVTCYLLIPELHVAFCEKGIQHIDMRIDMLVMELHACNRNWARRHEYYLSCVDKVYMLSLTFQHFSCRLKAQLARQLYSFLAILLMKIKNVLCRCTRYAFESKFQGKV